MSSINTNLGAMVALDTLKGINKNLGMVQNEISTGKSINNAKDNAAIWSISTVMETDVAGFEKIGNSLNLGSATVGVARTGAEDVVTNLQDIRDNIIAAQEDNVDRTKIQFDIDEAVAQIQSTVSGSQFNGSNLLNESGEISVLSSLDRSSEGVVTAAKINVSKANLSTADNRVALTVADEGFAVAGTTLDNSVAADTTTADALSLDTTAILATDVVEYVFEIGGTEVTATHDGASGTTAEDVAATIKGAIDAAGISGLTVNVGTPTSDLEFEVEGGTDASITLTSQTLDANGAGANAITTGKGFLAASASTDLDNSSAPATSADQTAVTIATAAAGDITGALYEATIGDQTASYTAKATDTQDDVATGLSAAINALAIEGVTAKVDAANANEIDFDVVGGTDASVTLTQQKVTEGKTVGGLAGLDKIDVTTSEGAADALNAIEAFLSTAIDAASEFGSKQKRIDSQIGFVSSLGDSLKAGISTLTDANLEEASARLQALQVQQQLGVQALSIANQAPQALLGLFR